MKSFRRFALLSGLLLAPGFALAAGPGGWTGPHIGVLVGANSVSSDNTSSELAVTASFLAGYDFQVANHFVLGIGGFYEWNEQKTHTIEGPCTGPCTLHYGSRVYGLDGRIGFPVGAGNLFMPYIKLGYGWGKLNGDLSINKNSPRYGVGIEWKSKTGTVSLLVQYMHQGFGSSNDNITNNNITIGANFFF